jgi:hypothetical protein
MIVVEKKVQIGMKQEHFGSGIYNTTSMGIWRNKSTAKTRKNH